MEEYKPIYEGDPKDFCWVGFGSGSGTNLRECAKVIKPGLIFSDRPKAKLLKLKELEDVTKLIINGFDHCGSWKKAKKSPELMAKYDANCIEFNEIILEELNKFEKNQGKCIDLIVLGGYMRLIKEPLLSEYKDKIINVHPADLAILDANHQRKYVGEDAVYDAIKAGMHVTKSSVIMVDKLVDHGEILVQGPEVRVWEEYLKGSFAEKAECLREYADAHQNFQKVRSDWPALTTALKLISEGKLALGKDNAFFNEWRMVYLAGEHLEYKGHSIKKAA